MASREDYFIPTLAGDMLYCVWFTCMFVDPDSFLSVCSGFLLIRHQVSPCALDPVTR